MKPMPVYAFRVDASSEIGTGHVMRCIALAMALRERGAECYFISRRCLGDLIEYIESHEFLVHELTNNDLEKEFDWKIDAVNTLKILTHTKVDWLVVDHYELGIEWESRMRSQCNHLMVIDDLADRNHDCDILLDQNLRSEGRSRYLNLVPENCQLLLGPDHAILRQEFDSPMLRERDGTIKHLLVYFGGNDKNNQALRFIEGFKNLTNLTAKVVLGPNHPYSDEVHAEEYENISIVNNANMMQEMYLADLAIGACGIAAWERCAVGLPSFVCVTANNQLEDAENLHKLGAVKNLGCSSIVDSMDWFNAIHEAIMDKDNIKNMGNAAHKVVTGYSENKNKLLDMLLKENLL